MVAQIADAPDYGRRLARCGIVARVAKVTIDKMMKPTLIFMILGVVPVVLVTTFWPDLSLFLPSLIMPSAMGLGG